MNRKEACLRIRKLAKRGSNEMLQQAVDQIYLAGVEAGMKTLSDNLKERLNDKQITNPGDDTNGERGQSDSSESSEGRRIDAANFDCSEGSTEPALNADPNESV